MRIDERDLKQIFRLSKGDKIKANLEQTCAAIIEPVGGHSGMDYYDFGLCGGLVNAGVRVTLYTCDETTQLEDLPYQIKPFYRRIYGNEPSWIRGLRYLQGSLRALWDAKKSDAQLCHFHFFHVGPLEVFNVCLSKLLGFRVVVTAHDVESFAEKDFSLPSLSRRVYHWADGVITHNQASKTEIVRAIRLPERKIKIIPHGNYLHAIESSKPCLEARNVLDVPLNSKVLLFFGQIKWVKGLDVLLQALPEVIEKFPETRLIIAGRVWKDDFEYYRKIVERHNLEPYCVMHTRYIPHEEVVNYFSAADLLVLPYRRIYQSGVLLMSMSYGKPVLASNLAGMTDIIDDEKTGFIFPANDSQALAEEIKSLFARPEHVAQVAQSGLQLMQEKYSWSRVGKMTADCYRSILE